MPTGPNVYTPGQATNLYMNWLNVSLTYVPPNGQSTTLNLTQITDIEPDAQTKQEMFYGDNRAFPRDIRNTEKSRSLSISGGDCKALMQIPEDVDCVITATLCDSRNGATAGAGAIIVTLNNARRMSSQIKAPNNKYGSGTVKFTAHGGPQDVDPLVIVAA